MRRPVEDGGNGPHQLVRMQAAFHQQLPLAFTDELYRFARCGVTVRLVDNVEAIDVETMLARYGFDFSRGTYQDRDDNSSFGGFLGSAQ